MTFTALEGTAGADDRKTAIGIIGCGNISHAYMHVAARSASLQLKACSNRGAGKAESQAKLYGCDAVSVEELLADPGIDCIVNLTPPLAHYEVSRRILESGKHLYCEKPFTVTLDEGRELLALAESRNLLIGCAPDTFLGRAHQVARAALDSGAIGRVVGGAVCMASRGMEHWHPGPDFFYKRGGGPLLDVGPYYITQLVNLLGPVTRVTALSSTAFARRLISSQPRAGSYIDVEVPTTLNGVLLFESGANVSLTMSWDVWKKNRPPIEIYGEDGTLQNPDPNLFTGKVSLSSRDGDWTEFPGQREDDAVDREFAPLGGPRGLGVIDLALAIREGRQPRASGRLAMHVLEVMLGLERAAAELSSIEITSRIERPAPL